MTLDEVKQSLKNAGRHVSMDAPLKDGDDSSSTMYDVLQTNDTPSPDGSAPYRACCGVWGVGGWGI